MGEQKPGVSNPLPNEEILKQNLGKIAYTLDKDFFSRLNEDFEVLPYDEFYNAEQLYPGETIPINTYVSNIRAIKIGRIVYDKSNNFTDCFENAISVFSYTGNTIAFVLNRYKDRTEIYAVVRNDGQGKNEESRENIELFQAALKGNFSGSSLEVIREKHDGYDTKKIFVTEKERAIYEKHLESYDNLTDGLAEQSLKVKLDELFGGRIESIAAICNIPSAKSKDYSSQNLEKLFNSVIPDSKNDWYSVIIFAESYTQERIHKIREGLEELASDIFPFQQHQFQRGETSTETQGEMQSLSQTESTNESISKTHSVNIGINGSRFTGNSMGTNLGIPGAGINIGKTSGSSIGGAAGYGYSWGKTSTKGHSDTNTTGTNRSITLGKSSGTTYNYRSYTVQGILSRLEQTLLRLKKGEAIGYWKYATYICSNSSKVSRTVASYIRALTQGEDSFSEPSIIAEWHKESANGVTAFDEIKKYILNFSHPVFINKIDKTAVNFSTNINTYELANAVSLPQHSIPGVPVAHGISFGREPHSLVKISHDIKLGCAYHMYERDTNRDICLGLQELTKHTFITGSTGSGKSNAVFILLSELIKKNIPFLVIEPAKGEYKNVFKESVNIFGTNPKVTSLLKINPFSFPEEAHVLEHLDRLVEIINVCWPMYAAMPAILKEAIERSYKNVGWIIETSENKYGRIFPSFSDVLDNIQVVLEESQYSEDNKSDYIGALCTRVRSLTNGINGMIFSHDELSNNDLFDSNTIVDLSRVGSTETKALIMGILVLKLQEYRQSQIQHNAQLMHVTVLEEAHNILKRTSMENALETANLVGKSVEMISNAIAEMRTYGEGFIIVDQAPQLLDQSVIRNTNTKIILRLPDQDDRYVAGKSVGLTDEQIEEISRLRRGVAVVSQSDWISPVLCDISEFKYDDNNYQYTSPQTVFNDGISEQLLDMIVNNELYRCVDKIDTDQFRKKIVNSNISGKAKVALLECLEHPESEDLVMKAIFEVLRAEKAFKKTIAMTMEIKEWAHLMAKELNPSIESYNGRTIDVIIQILLAEQSIRDMTFENLLKRYVEQIQEKGCVY